MKIIKAFTLMALFCAFSCNLQAKPYIKFKEPNLTKKYAKEAELKHGIPENLLLAIAHFESNRSPFAVNAQGRGFYFKTKEEAASFIDNLAAQGVRNMNVGFMQLNYPSHRKRFKSAEDMLDVKQNIAYAAKLLKALYAKTGNWEKAVELYKGGYCDSSTSYRKKIFTLRFKLPPIHLKDYAEEKYAVTIASKKVDANQFFLNVLGPKKTFAVQKVVKAPLKNKTTKLSIKTLSTNFDLLLPKQKSAAAFGQTYVRKTA